MLRWICLTTWFTSSSRLATCIVLCSGSFSSVNQIGVATLSCFISYLPSQPATSIILRWIWATCLSKLIIRIEEDMWWNGALCTKLSFSSEWVRANSSVYSAFIRWYCCYDETMTDPIPNKKTWCIHMDVCISYLSPDVYVCIYTYIYIYIYIYIYPCLCLDVIQRGRLWIRSVAEP